MNSWCKLLKYCNLDTIPARAYQLLLFAHVPIVSRFKPKLSTSIQIWCVILHGSALFKCCIKSFLKPRETLWHQGRRNLPCSLVQDGNRMYDLCYKKVANHEEHFIPLACKFKPGQNLKGRKSSFLRKLGRNCYPGKILGSRDCVDAVSFLSAAARASPAAFCS